MGSSISTLGPVGPRLELRLEGTRVQDGEGRVEEMLGSFMLGGVVLRSIILDGRILLKGWNLGRRTKETAIAVTSDTCTVGNG